MGQLWGILAYIGISQGTHKRMKAGRRNKKGEPVTAPLLFWGGGWSSVLESELEPVG
jgi:hypothetical protein